MGTSAGTVKPLKCPVASYFDWNLRYRDILLDHVSGNPSGHYRSWVLVIGNP